MKANYLDPRSLEPHWETDDDGRQFIHPGYEFRKCKECKKDFLCAKTSTTLLCGYKECNKK